MKSPSQTERHAFALAVRHGKVRRETTFHMSPSQIPLFAYGVLSITSQIQGLYNADAVKLPTVCQSHCQTL